MRFAMAVMAAGLAVPMLAQAANGFGGEATLGYLSTNGNSKTSSLNAKLSLNYTEVQWKNAFVATALGASSQNTSTAERYTADDQYNYNLTPQDFAFANADYVKDLFDAVGQRTTETVGYGRHFLTGPVYILDGQVGVGARQMRYNVSNQRTSDGILQLGGLFAWKISDTSTFSETPKLEYGASNTYFESVTELKMNIVGNLFAGLSYTLRHNSIVPSGTGKTDTVTAANISYAFGAK
ncbi:MAG: DUF481 domain-containing protein [Stenotrophobium sp.]